MVKTMLINPPTPLGDLSLEALRNALDVAKRIIGPDGFTIYEIHEAIIEKTRNKRYRETEVEAKFDIGDLVRHRASKQVAVVITVNEKAEGGFLGHYDLSTGFDEQADESAEVLGVLQEELESVPVAEG